jgi:hypothetical protein
VKLVFWVLERVGDRENRFSRKYRDLVSDEFKTDRKVCDARIDVPLPGRLSFSFRDGQCQIAAPVKCPRWPADFYELLLFLVKLECRIHGLQLGRKFPRGNG